MLRVHTDRIAIFSQTPIYADWEFIQQLIYDSTSTYFVIVVSIDGTALAPDYTLSLPEYDAIRNLKLEEERKGKIIKVIIESILEAPTYRYNLNILMNILSVSLKIPVNSIILLNGALSQFNDDVTQSISLAMFGTHHTIDVDRQIELPTKHFISLSRLAKVHRVLSTIEILDRKLESKGLISLGSGYYSNPAENEIGFTHIPERYKHLIPMYIDGIISPHTTDNINQYKATSSQFLKAFVNIVQETSYDRIINYDQSWNSAFLTEKSSKPFAWGQVPIFIACCGTVKYLRKLKFDMFDDIIDHSYDNESDPIIRIKKSIDQLELICNLPIDHWIRFKNNNMDRFVYNKKLIENHIINLNRVITVQNLYDAIHKMH